MIPTSTYPWWVSSGDTWRTTTVPKMDKPSIIWYHLACIVLEQSFPMDHNNNNKNYINDDDDGGGGGRIYLTASYQRLPQVHPKLASICHRSQNHWNVCEDSTGSCCSIGLVRRRYTSLLLRVYIHIRCLLGGLSSTCGRWNIVRPIDQRHT